MSVAAPSAYSGSTVVSCPNNAQACATVACTPACNTTNGICINGACSCYIEWLGESRAPDWGWQDPKIMMGIIEVLRHSCTLDLQIQLVCHVLWNRIAINEAEML